MTLEALDHVNVRTADLPASTKFYCEVLGLRDGARPPFAFGGAWLYCDEQAVVHLVEIPAAIEAGPASLEHFAFRARGLRAFVERLETHGIAYRLAVVPDVNITQVHLHDPDGNHIHVDFAPHETPGGGAGEDG